ncbi:hypothetical protein DT376_25875, partial [Pseudomonas aeruginosa]
MGRKDMTDHAELRRLAKRADALHGTPSLEHVFAITKFREAVEPKAILALLDEIDGLNDELSACTEHPGGCGYWREAAKRRAEERDRLRAQNDALRGALHAVQAEVDGNL